MCFQVSLPWTATCPGFESFAEKKKQILKGSAAQMWWRACLFGGILPLEVFPNVKRRAVSRGQAVLANVHGGHMQDSPEGPLSGGTAQQVDVMSHDEEKDWMSI